MRARTALFSVFFLLIPALMMARNTPPIADAGENQRARRRQEVQLFSSAQDADAQCNGNMNVTGYFTPGDELFDIVGLRYRFHVATNQQPGIGLKIIFGFLRLFGSAPETYLLENNLYTTGLLYSDHTCTFWPLLGTLTLNEASLRMAVPDYVQLGDTGAKTFDSATFPRQSYNIDGGPIEKTDMISQLNFNQITAQIEIARGELVADKSGWKCSGNLDSSSYRQWDATVSLSSTDYWLAYALPDANAKYLLPFEFINFRTEFFLDAGDFQVYVWDFQILREGSQTWIPHNRFIIGDHCGDLSQYGARHADFDGARVIEISNVGASDYLPLGTVFSIAYIPEPSVFEFAAQQLEATTQAVSSTQYPTYTNASGSWNTDDPEDWRSGFFPGSLWLMYDWSGEEGWRTQAERWLGSLEGEKNDTSTHDVGFKIFTSFGNAYRLTGNEDYRQVILTAAESLDMRYDADVGAIRSWGSINDNSEFLVIIDNMMNLEILFWASKNGGDDALFSHAVEHALTTYEHHVRPDGSTYQVVEFDPSSGDVRERRTHQGLNDESTWARGQAWAVYGFTMTYRETGDPIFLDAARETADYFIDNLPFDHVPFWDFDVTSGGLEDKDSSAAAIVASGLMALGELEPDSLRAQNYLDAALDILASLSSPAYLAEGTGNAAVLLHGTQNRNSANFDTGLIYGDYYFVEALLRYQQSIQPTPTAFDISEQTEVGVAVEITLGASDAQECELVFSIVDPPANGGLGPLVDEVCLPGSPNRDTATVLYTPDPGFEGVDSFTYKASDGSNDSNLAAVSLTIDVTPIELIFTPTADSKVKSTSPTRNYGGEATLRLRGGSPEWRTYLKFDLWGLTAGVSTAILRLYVTDEGSTGGDSNDGGSIFWVANDWTETGIHWNNAPFISGSPLDSVGSITTGTWVEYDVSSAVSGDGTISFGMTSGSTDSALFTSKEGSHPPELVVPEPHALLGLVSGIVLLRLLDRCRKARPRRG
jgi:hypothetical protein